MPLDPDDHADELYEKLQDVCEGYAACDVMYALGMMVAFAIAQQATNKDPLATIRLLGNVIALEFPRMYS